jgi:Arc/MetJ-type ribon-helix-helix transcriptional regulator
MSRTKAVISADPSVLAAVEAYVRDGRYASVSAFVREAMTAQLARVRQARLVEQVARYCEAPDKDEDDDLIVGQALPTDED